MQSSHTPYVDRPRVAFRIGVSGAVGFAPERLEGIHAQVAEVLRKICDEVLRCADSETAPRIYQSGKPILRLITPLADGADRLVAEEALKCHNFEIEGDRFQLDVPLPFAQAAYEATFAKETPVQHAASIAEFQRLLAAAGSHVLTLDGDSWDDIDRPRSYEAVGRLVVRNCDLLIAIWDDEKVARGRGGTTDTVRYALRVGVPVWWIHAAKAVPPKWLGDILDLPGVGIGRTAGTSPDDVLRTYIAEAILPVQPVKLQSEGAWEWIMDRLRSIAGNQTDPLLVFLNETGLPNRKFWNLHTNFIRSLRARGGRQHAKRAARHSGGPRALPPTPLRNAEPTQADASPRGRGFGKLLHLLGEPFRRNAPGKASSPAAGLSSAYQDLYRSSYTLVLFCGALALISAVIELVFDASAVVATFTELMMLGIILVLVVANELLRWHERYISYRMLGELLRMSQHLHRLGWALPVTRVTNLGHSTRRNWVAWFFAANVRATPLAKGHFSQDELGNTKRDVIENLIGGQLRFHDRRRTECNGAAHILGVWGRGFFFATLVFVLIRLILMLSHWGDEVVPWLALFCAVLPAVAAAFFGIRAYEELEVLAEQSEQMHEALRRAQIRIGRIGVDRPLASQLLGAELFDLTTIMLSDVAGWAQLFRMKAVEA